MRLLTLLLLLGAVVAPVCAQSAPPGAPKVEPKVVLQVSLVNNQREFRIGETIPLQLDFTATVKDRYQINMAQYDRSGRMNYEQFVVSPAEGAVDPLPDHFGGMGGLTSFKFLSSEPWTLKLNLNEWVRFTQPGEYRLNIVSRRVTVRDPANSYGASGVTARSNEIILKIVAADPQWQKQVVSDAVKILDQPDSSKPGSEYEAARRQAMETLRFLGTADAAREMAKRMRGEDAGGLDYICMLGLRSTPERTAARNALQEALADPDHPIDGTFFYALRMVNSAPAATNTDSMEVRQSIVEQLIAALNVKRGKALSTSLSTAVNEAWSLKTLPQETTDKLVHQLVSMFEQLPLQQQNLLLTYRWDKIGGAAMLPILKRHAQPFHDFPEMNAANVEWRSLSATALTRWYELDPVDARPAVINEISQPRPRYDARVLGILPDETLPELDPTLAENFSASNDFNGSTNIASLIARYATVAILPQIVEKLDPNIGKSACAVQSPLLAYLLRVDPALARPRIERALVARGGGFTACNRLLLHDITEIHYDPVLEEIAIRSLDDADPQVAATATKMLGNFGSPAAESALWQRYTSWSAKWAKYDSLPPRMMADPADERVYQFGLGQSLVQALATGKSWLADKNKLLRLSQITKLRQLQEQIDGYLQNWEGDTVVIYIYNASPLAKFHARLAQREFHSLKTLQEKVAQFPSATKFSILSAEEPPGGDPVLNELRAFLAAYGAKKN